MKELYLDKSNNRIKNVLQKESYIPYPFQQKAFDALDNLKKDNPKGLSSM